VSAQAFASGAITIGAVDGADGIGNTIESFSSRGPLRLLFPAPAPPQVQAPMLTAPDDVYVDAQGTAFQYLLFPGDLFEGTSASVPNAGAVAALLRGAFPALTVTQLVNALTTGAAQLGSTTPDATFGYGRIDALGALATLPSPTITALPDATIDAGATSSAYAFTVSGTGSLHFTVTSSNAALVPPQVVAAGLPGVTVAPASCGVGTMNCSLTITAAPGAGGTAALTIAAVDGANRSAPATMTITVNGPPPSSTPPPSAVSAPQSPRGGGGALGAAGIALLGVLAALRAAGIPGPRTRRRH
ncbi:MAG: S8 family serine peptidase, partial [Steroidobacteraceae bacterium]